MRKLLSIFISLKTTVFCLAWLTAIIFFGTLYQAKYGLHTSQEVWFFSWLLSPVEFLRLTSDIPEGWLSRLTILPGGLATLALLTLNLVVSIFIHFRLGWRMAGLVVVHAGLLLMMFGGAFIFWSSQESYLAMREGQITNLSEDHREWEIAFYTDPDPTQRRVHAVNVSGMQPGELIPLDACGLELEVVEYHNDARVRYRGRPRFEDGDRLAVMSQHLRAHDLLGWLESPGRFGRMRQSGQGHPLVVEVIVDDQPLSPEAATRRANLLRECDSIVAEPTTRIRSLVNMSGAAERCNFLTGDEASGDATYLLEGIAQRQLCVAILRSGAPQLVFDELVTGLTRRADVPFSFLYREVFEPPLDIDAFAVKPHRDQVENDLQPEKDAALAEALSAINAEPVSRFGRMWLGWKNLLGWHDPRYDAIEKVEKTYERYVQDRALAEEPERRVPAVVVKVTPHSGESVTLHLDGAYGVYGDSTLDAKIPTGAGTVYARLQKRHYELPVLVQLDDFIRTTHANESKDKEYISQITVTGRGGPEDEGYHGTETEATIEMNKPFRYQGYTMYQASFNQEVPDFTQLTVRFTTGRLLPYVSTAVVFLGLSLHFLLVLSESSKRLLKS